MIRSTSVLLLLLAACGAHAAEVSEAESPRPAIGKWLQPAWTPISPDAQIFLVAGARDSANFAQEIVDQRKFWLARGYTENQIECFYASPEPAHQADAQQFLALEEDLRSCHLAAPDIIYAALAEVARNYQHEYFYLYVTSHGTGPPMLQRIPAQELRNPGAAWFVEAREAARADPASEAHAWFSPYRMEVEGVVATPGVSWGWTSFNSRYVNLRPRSGATADTQLFTPKYLARALQKFPAAVRKIVVLQGCHTGGFLLPLREAPGPEESLVTVENVTVLTASRADRTSFGCGSADHTTYYGGSLQQVLDAAPAQRLADWDWRWVHEEVSEKVHKLESEQRIAGSRRSLPQFFSAAP